MILKIFIDHKDQKHWHYVDEVRYVMKDEKTLDLEVIKTTDTGLPSFEAPSIEFPGTVWRFAYLMNDEGKTVEKLTNWLLMPKSPEIKPGEDK